MEIGAAEYREAALANFNAAQIAHEKGLYSASHYLAGLAAECILRAYRWRIDSSWNGRHSLPKLLQESVFRAAISSEREEAFAKCFTEVTGKWQSQHRYASNRKLLQYLNEVGLTKNVKGEKLKDNSR